MKPLLEAKGVLSIGFAFLACFSSGTALAYEDAEDSPLYASSMQQAFADMAVRDRARPLAQAYTGDIITVEGDRWFYYAAVSGQNSSGLTPVNGGSGRAGSGGRRPGPLDVTMDVSCTIPTMCTTCYPTTCGASCDATPTCRGYPSCHMPCLTSYGPTCVDTTCRGETCNTGPTCAPFPTCFPSTATCNNATCPPFPTCYGTTCLGTCNPPSCPTALYDVRVPQPGQIQVSFNSSTQLKYTLQSCTNLSEMLWNNVSTVSGNGQPIVLSDTNIAPRTFYRLLVQTP